MAEPHLSHSLILKIGEQIVIKFKDSDILPSKKTVQLKSPNNGNIITVIQNGTILKYDFMHSENVLLTCEVNVNNEYTLKCYDLSNGQSKELSLKKVDTAASGDITSYCFPKRILKNDRTIDAVGVDWGNSSCYVAVNRHEGIQTIPLGNVEERMLSSYVSYDEKNEKCGQIGKKRLQWHSNASVFGIKRLIGKNYGEIETDKNWSFKIIDNNTKFKILFQSNNGADTKYPEEISTSLLVYMKKKIEDIKMKKLKEVVITVPMSFDDKQKEATRVAALLAGWETIHLLPDPIAAVFAYFTDKPIQNIFSSLLFDLGGGSLNIYIIEIQDKHIEIINHFSEFEICGKSFDDLLFNHFIQKLESEYGITDLGTKKYVLLSKCQEIKHALSVVNGTSFDVDEIRHSDEDEYISITRTEFEQMANKLLKKIEQTIVLFLNKSKYKNEWISKVILVGGSCHMPMIRKLLCKTFPKAEHLCDKNPDEVLAVGAALYACQSERSSSMQYCLPTNLIIDFEKVVAVGIDLGTSNCSVAVSKTHGIGTIPLDNEGRILPSYIAYNEKNEIVGQLVVNRLKHYAKSSVFDAKTYIGKNFDSVKPSNNWPFTLTQENGSNMDSKFEIIEDKNALIEVEGQHEKILKSPEEISADLLKYLKKKIEDYQGKKLKEVVITVPMSFDDKQKEATRVAALLAGWETIHLLPDPIAAIFAYFTDKPIPNDSTILTFDLGGSTLEICIFKIESSKIILLSRSCDTNLGGNNFDELLVDYIKDYLKNEFSISMYDGKQHEIKRVCHKIIKDMSISYEQEFHFGNLRPDVEADIPITRKLLESLSADLLDSIQMKIHETLTKFENNQIDMVLPFGGGCRMPMIKKLLLKIFPASVYCNVNFPDESVATGAALYAYDLLKSLRDGIPEKTTDESFAVAND
uniref:Heat shock protein 70 n=1 Tax=Panagrolaimus sp. PS1159 TaxID=55785 RepID=A0AC35FTG7_9BILA